MSSIYRGGHVATAFTTPCGETGLQYYGGNGKIAPEIISATTKRLHAMVNLISSTATATETSQPPQSTAFNYHYTHPITIQDNGEQQSFGAYQPLSREHAVAQPIQAPQLPALLYLYIINSLSKHYGDKGNGNDFHGLNTIFSILYAGRQSPTVILTDLWLHYRLEDLWIQIITAGARIVNLIENGPAAIDIPTLQQSQLYLFSLPHPSTPTQSPSTNPTSITAAQDTNISGQYTHYLINSATNHVFEVKFPTPTHLIKDEIPVLNIVKVIGVDDLAILLPNLHCNAVDQDKTTTTAAALLAASQPLSASAITTTLNIPAPLASTMNLIDITTTTTTLPLPVINTTLPLPRYKTASSSIGSKLYIHGGRAGFTMNYEETHQNKIIHQGLSTAQLHNPTILTDDAVMIEAILPLTPPKAIALVNKPGAEFVSGNDNEQTNDQNDEQQQQNDLTTINPTYASLILNDLWQLDVSVFPYQWRRLDQDFSEQGQSLPSHRFGHASAIVTLDREPSEPSSSPATPTTYLIIHGGLRLNHDRIETGDETATPTNSNNNNNDNTSSYHKALISSPTLFFLDITPYLSTTAPQSPPPSLKSFHFTPPLALDRPHHTDVSEQLVLPPSVQIGQRPFDLYGHQLIPIPFQTTTTDTTSNNENTNQTKIALLAIGGTSHTCLAAASVMVLEIDPTIFSIINDSINNTNQSTTISQISPHCPIYWSPIHRPIDDALFIRHTSTITSSHNTTTTTTPTQITTIGGGALCFSFGTYYSPTMNVIIECKGQGQGYSPLTPFQAHITTPTLTCTTPSTPQQQLLFQQQAIGAGVQNMTKLMNNQKQQTQQKKRRDNHTLIDTSKQIKGVAQICSVCDQEFDSKNKLFKHITISGHKRPE